MERQLWWLEHTLIFQQMMPEYLKNGTGYQTDAGMCGDYDSVIGMNKENIFK